MIYMYTIHIYIYIYICTHPHISTSVAGVWGCSRRISAGCRRGPLHPSSGPQTPIATIREYICILYLYAYIYICTHPYIYTSVAGVWGCSRRISAGCRRGPLHPSSGPQKPIATIRGYICILYIYTYIYMHASIYIYLCSRGLGLFSTDLCSV